MSDDKADEILCVRESLWRTVVNDAIDIGSLIGSIGVGVWIGSEVLQWIAGLLFILVLFDRSVKVHKRQRKTPQQAADWLQAEFGVRATKP